MTFINTLYKLKNKNNFMSPGTALHVISYFSRIFLQDPSGGIFLKVTTYLIVSSDIY